MRQAGNSNVVPNLDGLSRALEGRPALRVP